ncbi:MAG: hypothetical protein JXQ26_05970 [Tissierellales bacterium]|nr:hypothetical protein [Tissierellales bacterium]MBN2827513.1 hypothetical protein [Tissierellales bacterium]
MDYIDNYEVKEIIYENNFQRISLCVNNQDESEFYNNIIISSRIIDLLDMDLLNAKCSNIIGARKEEDRAYIMTRKIQGTKLSDHILNNELTMTEQLRLSEKLLETFKELESFEDLVQEAMTTDDNILIDNESIVLNNLLIFSQDYDIRESMLVKAAGNFIHYIYTKEFINDFQISDSLPPDVMRLIIRCYSNQYLNINQVIEAFRNSATYSLVSIGQSKAEHQSPQTKFIFNGFEEKDDDENKQDSFPDENNKERFHLSKTQIALILIFLIPLLILFMGKLNNNGESQKDPEATEPTEVTMTNPNPSEEGSSNLPETINNFFSQDLLDASTSIRNAEIDFTKFYDGYSSLVVTNTTGETERTLFAVVDLKQQTFNYLKNRQVGISIRLTGDLEKITGSIIAEVIEEGKIATFKSEKVNLSNGLWVLNQSDIKLGNAEKIELYFEFSDIATVWIDGIEIDILK